MVDGEWWRLSGSRRDGAGAAAEEPGESVYLPRPTVPAPAAPASPPAEPAAPRSATVPAPSAPPQPSRPPRPPGPSRPPTPGPVPGGSSAPRAYAEWDSVHIDLSVFGEPVAEPDAGPGPKPSGEPQAGERAPGEPVAGEPQPGEPSPSKPGTPEPDAAATAPSRAGLMAGRRPSPLLLLATVVLLGGAVTGLVLVMLVGWALAYLSRRLGDLTRKFAVLGIPLMTMTGLSLWFWGRSQGRWGVALQPGQQVGQQVWGAAPGVLRLAAVLSALFLLGVTLRRRGGK